MGDCGCDSAAADEEEDVGEGVEVEGWAVRAFEEDGDLVLEVSVADDDLGRVIGRGGRIANAIRTVARAAGARDDRRVIVDILD